MFARCPGQLFAVHPWICAGRGFSIKRRKAPGAEDTWLGASWSWLIPPKFGPSKGETRGKKEHPAVGQCPPTTGPCCLHQNHLCTTSRGVLSLQPDPQNVGAKVLGREARGFCASDEIPPGCRDGAGAQCSGQAGKSISAADLLTVGQNVAQIFLKCGAIKLSKWAGSPAILATRCDTIFFHKYSSWTY